MASELNIKSFFEANDRIISYVLRSQRVRYNEMYSFWENAYGHVNVYED